MSCSRHCTGRAARTGRCSTCSALGCRRWARPVRPRRAWSKPIASRSSPAPACPVPESIVLSHEAFRELGAASVLRVVRGALEGDLVVKPGSGGSAQGVTIVDDYERPAARDGRGVHVRRCRRGRATRGRHRDHGRRDRLGRRPRALTPVEIEPTSGVYGFQARYNAGETTFYAPSRLDDDVAVVVSDAAVLAHRTLGLRDLSRVDFIVDPGGTPWFLEANVIPGLTETSLVPLAIEASAPMRRPSTTGSFARRRHATS